MQKVWHRGSNLQFLIDLIWSIHFEQSGAASAAKNAPSLNFHISLLVYYALAVMLKSWFNVFAW